MGPSGVRGERLVTRRFALAVLKTARYLRDGLPFNLGWWGFTFPLAVYTLATLALAHVTHFALFTISGGVLVVCLAAFWANRGGADDPRCPPRLSL